MFDRVKLKWVNAQHLRALDSKTLWTMIEPFLVKAGIQFSTDLNWQMKSVEIFKPKMEILSDAVNLYKTLDEKQFHIGEASREALTWETTPKVLQTWIQLLKAETATYLTEADFVRLENEVKTQAAVKGKNLFMPMRVAVIGEPHGTELKLLVPMIERASLIRRAEKVLSQTQA